MRMTISRKLIGGFLGLALLVLIAGLVGIVVLNKVSTSADTVAREKAPTQYAVMNAALVVDKVQKMTLEYLCADSGLDQLAAYIEQGLEEVSMWVTILEHGTQSAEFAESPSKNIYTEHNSDLIIPPSSAAMRPIVADTVEKIQQFKEQTKALMGAHQEIVSYGVVVEGQFLDLPAFLNLAQRYYLEWIKALKDAVNIETKFTGDTDPTTGLIGSWLETYQVPNENLMEVRDKFKAQYAKINEMAVKINKEDVYKKKLRTFNRGIATNAKIEAYFSELHELSKTLYDRLRQVMDQRQEAVVTTVADINEQLNNLIDVAASEMHQALGETASAKKQGITILIVLTVLAVVVAIVLGTLVSRFMASKITSIAESTKNIAAGDLRRDLEVSSDDELGDLAHDTNSMIANLREIIGKILVFSNKLTTSAEDLAGVSKDFDTNAEGLEKRAVEASEATSTMNASMQDISELANDSMQRVQSVATATEEMASTIDEIARNAEQARAVTSTAVKTVENTTSKMTELSEAANEIGKVAEVIVSIAEQTNLLSLNATIEAARAGDAGKGFAVVANEVKELAGQTNSATEDIRQRIAAIQQSSNMTISEITEIAKIINEINSIVVVIAGAVEEQAVTTKQITEDINSVSTGIEGMTGHVNSATEVSDRVAVNIDHVKNTSGSIGQGSSYIQQSSTELEKLASELNRLVGQFKI